MASETTQSAKPQWWTSFPEVQSSCDHLEAADVMELLENDMAAGESAKRQFLLVDVRQVDWEGGTITTSINLPAQSFYQTRPVVYRLCKQAGIETIIFYCGSSNGRGPRSAGWMQDYLNEVGETKMKAVILKGGIKGWEKTYVGKMMDAYDSRLWGRNIRSN